MMVMTAAVKNLFGCIPGKKKVQWHFNTGIDHKAFAQMLVELTALLKPRLNILDAVLGMEGNGPGSGDPRFLGLILASQDAISLDVVSGIILGLSPMQVPVIRAARETGIGESRVECINVLGESLDDVKVKDFILPQFMHTEWPIPEWLRRCLKNALTTRPVINHEICIRCGLCRDDCPQGAIGERHGVLRIDYRNCIRCFCCQEFCPKGAISIRDGWMLRLAG
jgi:ferredoxin